MDHARNETGEWEVDRRLLASGGIMLGIGVLAVFPLRVLPAPWFADSLLHFAAGMALTLAFAAAVPRSDHLLAAVVIVIGVVWEPIEWFHFMCTNGEWLQIFPVNPGVGNCSEAGFIDWMTGADTLKDMSLVCNGVFTALISIGRYD